MASVALKNINKIYGREVRAVKDVTLEIKDREFLVLVGPSGCGKTTLLRLIAGLEEISSGDIFIGDKKVNDIPPKDRDIAMVFQNYALYPHMNVYENISFGLKIRKTPKNEIRKRVEETSKLLGIETLLLRKPKELSGGQRQRVAMGRAIVRQPKVFLMDEPLSNLDAQLRVLMRAELQKLHRKLGITTIYVTHDQTEAMTLGGRIAALKDGIIQQVDSPIDLYERPANLFVAGFIGSPAMNLMEASVGLGPDNIVLKGGGFQLKVPSHFREKLNARAGRSVVLGIRPEDIHPSGGEGAVEGNILDAAVEVVEPMGADLYLHLTVGKETWVARMDPKTNVKSGDTLKIAPDMNKIRLFDPSGGEAL